MMTTNRRIPLVAGGAAILLVVIWYFMLWSPETKHLKAAHQAQAAAEQKVSQRQALVSQLQALVPQIPSDEAKFAQLEQQLPNNPQLDQALGLLHQAAVQSGVTLGNVSPSAPAGAASGSGQSSTAKTSGTPAISLSMSAVGSFNQIKVFLTALAGLPRTVVVDKVSVSAGTTSSASLTARIFYAGLPTP